MQKALRRKIVPTCRTPSAGSALLSSRLPEADAPGNTVTHLAYGRWQFGLLLILIMQDVNISLAVGVVSTC